jgi:hypothetical protein
MSKLGFVPLPFRKRVTKKGHYEMETPLVRYNALANHNVLHLVQPLANPYAVEPPPGPSHPRVAPAPLLPSPCSLTPLSPSRRSGRSTLRRPPLPPQSLSLSPPSSIELAHRALPPLLPSSVGKGVPTSPSPGGRVARRRRQGSSAGDPTRADRPTTGHWEDDSSAATSSSSAPDGADLLPPRRAPIGEE